MFLSNAPTNCLWSRLHFVFFLAESSSYVRRSVLATTLRDRRLLKYAINTPGCQKNSTPEPHISLFIRTLALQKVDCISSRAISHHRNSTRRGSYRSGESVVNLRHIHFGDEKV